MFIDEFDTFNAPKKRLLSALLTALPQVTVALCDDGAPLVPGDTGLFAGAKQMAAQLRQLARKSGTEVAAPELLRRDLRHKGAPGLAAVAALLEGNGTEVTQAPEVRLFPAASREEEARCAAAAIRRCAVENNVTMFTALDTVRVLLDVLEETTLCISTVDAD